MRYCVQAGSRKARTRRGKAPNVDEHRNPYAPPKSDTSVAPTKDLAGTKRVFSPAQGSVGTFFGGPLAGTYFLRANYLALGQGKRAMQATIGGILVSVAILLSLPFLPEKMPHYVLPIAYMFAVRFLIERSQFTKKHIVESGHLTFQSNWRVAGVAVIGIVLFVLVGVA